MKPDLNFTNLRPQAAQMAAEMQLLSARASAGVFDGLLAAGEGAFLILSTALLCVLVF